MIEVVMILMLVLGTTSISKDESTVTTSYTKGGSLLYIEPEPVGPVRQTNNDCRLANKQRSGECDTPSTPDNPNTPDPTAPDNPDGKQKSDNSDANGKGGNKHDRSDKDKPSQEIAENKKGK